MYSLLLNAVLATVVLFLIPRPHKTATLPVSASAKDTLAEATPQLRHFIPSSDPVGSRAWVSTLRDAGVPVRVLARVVREVFDDQWQKRQSQAQAAYMRGDADADSLALVSLEHDQEQEQAMRAALGDEDFRKWDKQNVLSGLNLQGVKLTDAQSDALYDLEKKHQEQLNQILASKLKHEIDPATDEQEQAGVEADYDSQLKALLGEQNYAAMRGTPDDTAGQLKRVSW